MALAADRRLERAESHERATLARDSYSYVHLPMISGIVLIALGIKKTLEHVGDPLTVVPAVALCGGVALYLIGHNAFRLREHGTVSVSRLVAAGLALALVPAALILPSLLSLVAVAKLLVTLAAFETVRERTLRRRLRAR